jgi:prepilin-type N-terminal cleavage/methylation domain-containing protein
MNRLRLKAEGFTLIELLVVIAIIGILAAIAIPQFAAYRRRGYDSDAKSAVKNMSTAQEAYFTDRNTYTASTTDLTNRGLKQSANIGLANPAAAATTFIVSATVVQGCSSGTGVWTFASSTGLLTGTPCG